MLAGPGKIYCTFGTRSAATVILLQHLSRGNIAAEIFIESDPNISSLNDPAYKSSIPIVYKRDGGCSILYPNRWNNWNRSAQCRDLSEPRIEKITANSEKNVLTAYPLSTTDKSLLTLQTLLDRFTRLFIFLRKKDLHEDV